MDKLDIVMASAMLIAFGSLALLLLWAGIYDAAMAMIILLFATPSLFSMWFEKW